MRTELAAIVDVHAAVALFGQIAELTWDDNPIESLLVRQGEQIIDRRSATTLGEAKA